MEILRENKQLGIIYGVNHGELFLTIAGRSIVATDTPAHRDKMKVMYEDSVMFYNLF